MSGEALPSDDQGRFVWLVTWGGLGRSDWLAALVLAYDADDALEAARRALPDRLSPDHAFLASADTARAALSGNRDVRIANLRLLE